MAKAVLILHFAINCLESIKQNAYQNHTIVHNLMVRTVQARMLWYLVHPIKTKLNVIQHFQIVDFVIGVAKDVQKLLVALN